MTTTEIFLGIIALAVLVMAIIQAAGAIAAARAARRMSELMTSLERDVRPIVVNLQALSADAARATALAAAQVDKADRLINALSKRIDDTVSAVQELLVQPARDGLAVLSGLKAMIAALREPSGAPRRGPAGEEEDLFIG